MVLRNFESLHPSTDLVQLPTSSFTKKLGVDPAGMGALMFSSIVGCGVLRELTWANNACTAGLLSSLSMEARSEPHPTCSPHRLTVMDLTGGDQVPWTEDGIQRRQRVTFGSTGR